MDDFRQRAALIELLLLDVDGVLTDGSITYTESGDELKTFHVRDGSGLKIWVSAGKKAAIVTGRRSGIVDRRAVELGIAPVLQGRADKQAAFAEVLNLTGITANQVCAIGDDLPDLSVLSSCGLAVAVADACPEAKAAAHVITESPGGRGAVRETIERIMRSTGTWDRSTSHFRPAG